MSDKKEKSQSQNYCVNVFKNEDLKKRKEAFLKIWIAFANRTEQQKNT